MQQTMFSKPCFHFLYWNAVRFLCLWVHQTSIRGNLPSIIQYVLKEITREHSLTQALVFNTWDISDYGRDLHRIFILLCKLARLHWHYNHLHLLSIWPCDLTWSTIYTLNRILKPRWTFISVDIFLSILWCAEHDSGFS